MTTETSSQSITVETIREHIKRYEGDKQYDGDCWTMEYDEETKQHFIAYYWWNNDDETTDNETLDGLAGKEFNHHLGDGKKNLMWVEDIKKMVDWSESMFSQEINTAFVVCGSQKTRKTWAITI